MTTANIAQISVSDKGRKVHTMVTIWLDRHKGVRGMMELFSAVICSVSIVAICGHISGRTAMFDWGFSVGMGLPSAVCFVFVAIVLFWLVQQTENCD